MRRMIYGGAAALALALTQLPPLAEADIMAQSRPTDIAQHQAWTGLLSKYVQPSEDGVNRFDYSGLRDNDTDSAALDKYIAEIAAADFETLSDDEAFAAWANLYNALTVRLITENLPLKSITRIRPSPFAIGPWKQKIITVGGRKRSLDDIEHNILRKDWDEPRVHYAVNCASFSCPNLRVTAWEATTLDEDLTQAARDYINNPRAVRVREDGRLVVSTIYKWYRKDFGGNEAGVISHLLEYAEADLTAQIRAKPDIADYDYDWSLNDADAANESGS